MTTIESGLNTTQIASGLNLSLISSSIDTNGLIYSGLLPGNLTAIVSAVNVTGVLHGLNITRILLGVDLERVLSGIHLKRLLRGLNLEHFVPALLHEFPHGVVQVKQALWTYPSLIFAQSVSSIFFGRLSDYLGRRWIFLFGNLVSFVAFLATARAKEGSSIAGLVSYAGLFGNIEKLIFEAERPHRDRYRHSDFGSLASTRGACPNPSPFYSNSDMLESLGTTVGSSCRNRYV